MLHCGRPTIIAALAAAWACFGALLAAAQQRPIPADLELAFVVDASGSIDDAEMRLQRQGYLDTLSHPKIIKAIRSGVLGRIAVAYIEFAGGGCERIRVGWTAITSKASALTFGRKMLAQERIYCPGSNAIADAVLLTAQSNRDNGFEGTRRVIDVSGDGPKTMGPAMTEVRDAVVNSGIIFNALMIHRESYPDLDVYYRNTVNSGPRSFVIKAESQASFADAILRKLVREIVTIQPVSPVHTRISHTFFK